MKILLVTQYFYPENFRSNDIAFEMVKRGHHVDVLTSIPNYPEGKFYKGYGYFSRKKECINGVKIHRIFTIPRGNNKITLFLNYLSYWLWGVVQAFRLSNHEKYDCVIVHQTSPIMQAYPGIMVARRQKIPLYMWVLDVWPDSMISGGGIRNRIVVKLINKMVTNIYEKCYKILISSKGFRELINRNGDFNKKIVYFPNWADDVLIMPQVKVPILPKGIKIMMAGNLGEAQKLDAVMTAILELRDVIDLKWIFVGDGSKRQWMESFVKEHNLEENVCFLGRRPFSEMPAFFKQADVLLVTLKADFPHLKAVVPARLQTYMSAERPVLAMADGGVAELLKEANCGLSSPAGNSQAFVQLIRNEVLPHLQSFRQKGKNGRKYYEEHFTKEHCMDNLEKILS